MTYCGYTNDQPISVKIFNIKYMQGVAFRDADINTGRYIGYTLADGAEVYDVTEVGELSAAIESNVTRYNVSLSFNADGLRYSDMLHKLRYENVIAEVDYGDECVLYGLGGGLFFTATEDYVNNSTAFNLVGNDLTYGSFVHRKKQEGGEEGEDDELYLRVSPNTLVVSTDGDIQVVNVSCNYFWRVEDLPSWVHPDIRSGRGDGTITLTIDSTDEDYREGGFNVVSLGLTAPVGITQIIFSGLIYTQTYDACHMGSGPIVPIGEWEYEIVSNDVMMTIDCVDYWLITFAGEITEIPERAFWNQPDLERILSLPETVTTIGANAFSHSPQLKSINLNDGITTIGENAFMYDYFDKIVLPDSVTEIGRDAFFRCPKLNSVTLSDNLITIGEDAFAYCLSLKNLNIPEGVTTINGGAFSNSGIIEMVLPSTLENLGDGVFGGCTNLVSINIPEGITEIPYKTFIGCRSLPEIEIPDNIVTIGGSAFRDCTSLTEVTIPDSVLTIGGNAFQNCTSLYEIVIPDSVLTIGGAAFYGCTSLHEVTISENATSIGVYAFMNCSNLNELTIPASVTSIGGAAFENTGLTALIMESVIPPVLDGEPYIPSDCAIYIPCASYGLYSTANIWKNYKEQFVEDCSIGRIIYTSDNESVRVPNVTSSSAWGASIVSNVYQNGYGIITFDGPIAKIPAEAFKEDFYLRKVWLPCSITEIQTKGFYYNSLLREIVLPSSLETIGVSACELCKSMRNVSIPDSVTAIGDRAFYGCGENMLEMTLTLPANQPVLGKYIFAHCEYLQKVVIPEGWTTTGEYMFAYCDTLFHVTFPSTLKTIAAHTFNGIGGYYPRGLSPFVLPEGLERIERGAFTDCRFSEMTVPASVTYLGSVGSGDRLENIYLEGATPPTLFSYQVIPSDAIIHVPCGSGETYKTASQWDFHASKIDEGCVLEINPTEMVFGFNGGTFSLQITSDSDWTIE